MTLDTHSVSSLVGESPAIMVYGFAHCHFWTIKQLIQDTTGTIQRVWDYRIGDSRLNHPIDYTHPYGGKVCQIDCAKMRYDSQDPDISAKFSKGEYRDCKAALTNIVLDNYRHSPNGEHIATKIFFCIDSTSNPYPLSTENWTSRVKLIRAQEADTFKNRMNSLVTHSELRRAYKLCSDDCLPEIIKAIAEKTFVFVKVKIKKVSLLKKIRDAFFGRDKPPTFREKLSKIKHTALEFRLKKVEAPWKKPDFKTFWESRKSTSKAPGPNTDWRYESQDVLHMIEYDRFLSAITA